MNVPIIELKNISKKYLLWEEKTHPTLTGRFFHRQKKDFWALKNINLSIKKGEVVGIIGPNGAGKSTLLKIIARVTFPTEGEVVVRKGKIASVFALGGGFIPDLSGRENIFLNGLLLGMRRSEIKDKLSKIISFSGLEKFINAPLYTYSEGMVFRLGASIALFSDAEISISDDVVYIADQIFQKKLIEKRMQKVREKAATSIFSSHEISHLFQFCSRIIWLENGRIKKEGSAAEVIPSYRNAMGGHLPINPRLTASASL